MHNVNAMIVFALAVGLIAALMSASPPIPVTYDLRIPESAVSDGMLEVIPGLAPAKAGRIRRLVSEGYELPDAVRRFLSDEEARRFSLMLQEDEAK